MSLNDTKIRSLKPSEKSFKVSDSHGLYLLVNPGGSRLWYPFPTPGNNETVSASCWRRTLTPLSNV